MEYIKGKNGNWYPRFTNWRYVSFELCNALENFSEADQEHPIYKAISDLLDKVDDLSYEQL